MKRRNRESRSRIKLIQEKRLTKEEQAYIGNALLKQKKRYTAAYTDYRNGLYFSYDLVIGMMRGSRACAAAGVSVSQVTDAVRNLAEAAKYAINT
ncbi:MAG: hypothetical protein IKY18_06505 [Oscillospiraceae bacterium]|nr:hypothetical protein [Oscillospiraceae bacterium]